MVLTLPAMVIIAVGVNAYQALIVSQVVLSLQLPFTIIPLLWLSRSRAVMGGDRTGTIARRSASSSRRSSSGSTCSCCTPPSGEAERMGMYERILVPIEGTRDRRPRARARRQARRRPAAPTVMLLRVAHYHTRDQRACEIEDGEGDLARAAERLRGLGIAVEHAPRSPASRRTSSCSRPPSCGRT